MTQWGQIIQVAEAQSISRQSWVCSHGCAVQIKWDPVSVIFSFSKTVSFLRIKVALGPTKFTVLAWAKEFVLTLGTECHC